MSAAAHSTASSAGVHELRGNRRMKRGPDSSHVIPVNGDARSYLDDLAHRGSIHGRRFGGGHPFAKLDLCRGAFHEPAWAERS